MYSKKYFYVINTLIIVFCFPLILPAQECNCNTGEELKSGSYYSGADFNCYQYVRGYFARSYAFGAWEPNPNNSNESWYPSNQPSNNFTVNPGPDFNEVSDPSKADVVYYPDNDHAAVIVGETCLVEKVGYGSQLRKFGFNNPSVNPSDIVYFEYTGTASHTTYGVDESCLDDDDGGEGTPDDCTISGEWVSDGSPLYTYNSTDDYFNEVEVSCSTANSFDWSVASGSVAYSSCNNSPCSRYYFYLNEGQSVTFNVDAINGSTQVGTKDFTFSRSGGYKLAGSKTKNTPDSYQLKQNYPNPFNPETKISFSLPEQSEVKLEVYDMIGRKMTTLINEVRAAGTYNVSFNASNLNSGTYIYRLETSSFTQEKTMTVIK